MSKLLEYFNPLTWLQKAATIAIAVVLVWGALWWFNSKIRDHYQAPLIAEYKAAADEAERSRAKRELINHERKQEANDAQRKTLEKNRLAAARAAAGAVGLRDAIRASEDRAQADLSACVQHASTLGELLNSGAELARRIAAEADGHAADKIACTAAWPQ